MGDVMIGSVFEVSILGKCKGFGGVLRASQKNDSF